MSICTTSYAGVFIQNDELSRKPVRHRSIRANMLDSVMPSNEDDDYFGFAFDASSDIICNSHARRIARNRCRYQYLNDPYAHNIARSFAVTVVGTGAELQVTRVMGVDCDTEDFRAARELVEERFKAWAISTELFSKIFLMTKSLMFDGESFLRFVRNPFKPNELDVTVVDAQRVTEGYPSYTDKNTIDGIRFDSYGNPISYSILKTVLNQSYQNVMDFEIVPADQVYHLFVQELPEQHRGLPLMQSSLKSMSALRRYNAAVVEAAETAAAISVLIKTPFNPQTQAPVEAEAMDTISIPRRGGLTLPDGADAQQMKAEQPTATHREFVTTNLTAAGAGCGMPRNIAANDSSDYNYSSVRMDHQTYFRYVEYVQGLVTKLTNFVFDTWYSVDSEAQELLNWVDPSLIRRDWYFRELEHVDPSKEATATINLRNNGLLTMKEHYAKYGQDWKEQLAQWKTEQEMIQGMMQPVEEIVVEHEGDEDTVENLLQELRK